MRSSRVIFPGLARRSCHIHDLTPGTLHVHRDVVPGSSHQVGRDLARCGTMTSDIIRKGGVSRIPGEAKYPA